MRKCKSAKWKWERLEPVINVGTSIPALGMDTEVEENCPKTPPGSAQQQSPGQCLTPPVPPSSPAGCRLLVPPLPAKRSSGLMGSCSAGAQETWVRDLAGRAKGGAKQWKNGLKGKEDEEGKVTRKGAKAVAPLLPPLPGEVPHRGRSRLCSSQQEALDPAELLQRSMHVNQPDRQRGEKQGG